MGEADLVDTLKSADALTVFAPTDDAFGKIPEKDLNAVLADKDLLTSVLTHHVVAGQLGPDEIAGADVDQDGFSEHFRRHVMAPMIAAVWSCDPAAAPDYPARYLFAFLDRHGMLQVFGSPRWRNVAQSEVQRR